MRLGLDLAFRLTGGTIPWVDAFFRNARALHPSLEVVVFSSRANIEDNLLPGDSPWPVVVNQWFDFLPSERVRSWSDALWQQTALPRLAVAHGVDVLFSIGNRCPLWGSVPRIQLVGNALTLWPGLRQFPVSQVQRLHHTVDGRMIAAGAARAEYVITESQFEVDLLREVYGVVPARVRVLNNGRSDFFERPVSGASIDATLARLGIVGPFLLCVAHITCYSNHVRLIEAYARVRAARPELPPLLVCGSFRHEWVKPQVMEVIGRHGLEGHVRLMGNVSRADLPVLFRTCELFVFPSLIEGFAYTLIEAMTCGAPIVCSGAPVMPETCGDAALYFDPTNASDIAATIETALDSPALRARLRDEGPRRAATFPSEADVARTILEICDELSVAHSIAAPAVVANVRDGS